MSYGHFLEMVRKATWKSEEACNLLIKRNLCSGGRDEWMMWTPLYAGKLKLNTNGYRKTTSGMAYAGGLVRDHNGKQIFGFAIEIGQTYIFMAELWGLK